MIYSIVLGIILATALVEYVYVAKRRQKTHYKFTLLFSSSILFFLSAVRYQEEFSDFWVNYRRMIEAKYMTWIQCISIKNGISIGNSLFRKFVIELFKDPQWYFVISALIIVGCSGYFFNKYSPNRFLSILLYYTIGTYFTSNNITRQAMACAIVIVSWKYIIERKFWKYILLMSVAVSIHISAVFFVPMYFLCRVKLRRNQFLIYILAGITLLIIRNPIISFFQRLVYSNYTDASYGTTGSSPLRLILYFVIAVYLYVFIRNRDNAIYIAERCGINNSDYFINLIGHGTIISILLSILSVTNMLLFSRLEIYWNYASLLCIVIAIKATPKNKWVLSSGIILAAIAWFSISNITGKLIPTPYTPFWMFPARPRL